MEEKILATIVPTAIKFDVTKSEVTAFLACTFGADGNASTIENAVSAEIVKMTVNPKNLRFFVDKFIAAGRDYEKTFECSLGFSIDSEVDEDESNEIVTD